MAHLSFVVPIWSRYGECICLVIHWTHSTASLQTWTELNQLNTLLWQKMVLYSIQMGSNVELCIIHLHIFSKVCLPVFKYMKYSAKYMEMLYTETFIWFYLMGKCLLFFCGYKSSHYSLSWSCFLERAPGVGEHPWLLSWVQREKSFH